MAVEMFDRWETAAQESYDCVFSFDVFEHIKNIAEALKNIYACLRPGGSLIFSGAFSGGTLHLEENEQYNDFKAMNDLMGKSGFAFEKKFAQFYFYKKR